MNKNEKKALQMQLDEIRQWGSKKLAIIGK